MGKNKLKKFDEMEKFPFVLQYPWGVLQKEAFPFKGKWSDFFGNDNPIVLELGCGKGEYTVGLARLNHGINFIGIDVKGARMWTGARQVLNESLENVAFLRTDIELLPYFFDPGEVSEIWITFPDPQMQKARKRLTGSRMVELYRKVIKPEGKINLKTDSPFLYVYTGMLCRDNGLTIYYDIPDIYSESADSEDLPQGLREIKTHYECQWIERGLSIKFLSFSPDNREALREPDKADSIEKDTYRSYSRGYITTV